MNTCHISSQIFIAKLYNFNVLTQHSRINISGLYSNASAFALVSANAAFAFALAFDCAEVGAFAFALAS